MSADVDTEKLATLLLAQLWEAANKAQITLPDGKVILPTDAAWDSLINLGKWGVTTLKAKKPKFVASAEDFQIKKTKRGEA